MTHKGPTKGHQIYKGQSNGEDKNQTGYRRLTLYYHQMQLQHICHSHQPHGHHSHQPNSCILANLVTRPPVHHGGNPFGFELHFLQIDKEQNRGRDDHGLPEDVRQNEPIGTWPQTPPVRPKVLRKIQAMHKQEQHDSQIGPA
jgi:hypothetical protein